MLAGHVRAAACAAGARRVYAIEPGEVIGVARDLATSKPAGRGSALHHSW